MTMLTSYAAAKTTNDTLATILA